MVAVEAKISGSQLHMQVSFKNHNICFITTAAAQSNANLEIKLNTRTKRTNVKYVIR